LGQSKLPKNILIVDDDESILRSLSRVLHKNGYSVEVATTASEALNKLKNRHFDLALIDVILPDMKGTELLVKAKEDLKQTVKFIITGYPSAETGAKARDEGADAFILKPISMVELLSVIQVFLSEEERTSLGRDEERWALSGIGGDLT
jgi:DNA-binding response OmpR family regulator